MAERSGLQQGSSDIQPASTTTRSDQLNPVSSSGGMYPGAAQGPVQGSTEQLSASAVNHILMEFLVYFGRALAVFYPVYLTGYLGLSISWVLLCMMMITWWKKNRKWKDIRMDTAIEFLDNEAQVITKELKTLNMATWVCMLLRCSMTLTLERLSRPIHGCPIVHNTGRGGV